MNPMNVFLERTFTMQALCLLTIGCLFLFCFLLHGGGAFGVICTIGILILGWCADYETFTAVPKFLEDEENRTLAFGSSLISNLIVGFIVLINSQSVSPSMVQFLVAVVIKLAVPIAYACLSYNTFLSDVFPTLESAIAQQTVEETTATLADTERKWKEMDRQAELQRENDRVKAVGDAQQHVLGFYTQHRVLLKNVQTDAMILTKVRGAIPASATLEQANAAAHMLLKELQEHLRMAQARAQVEANKQRDRQRKMTEIDAQIAKLTDRLGNVKSSPMFADDPDALAAETAGIQRQIDDMQTSKAELATSAA